MKWFKSKKMKALVGGIVATAAATYGIQMNGGPDEEAWEMKCKCTWYNDIQIVEKGVNKK